MAACDCLGRLANHVSEPETDDSRDLAQEIIIQLWRSFGRYDERQANFSTWMYRNALNAAIFASRRRHGSLDSRVEPLEQRHLETIASTPEAPERDERVEQFYAFVVELEPYQTNHPRPYDRRAITRHTEDDQSAPRTLLCSLPPLKKRLEPP